MPHKDSFYNGERVPSTTEIIGVLDKPWKWGWYKSSVMKQGKAGWMDNDRKSQQGRDIGTAFHDKVYMYIVTHKMPRKNDRLYGMLSRFRAWYDNCGLEPISLEPDPPLISKRYLFSGTYDCVFIDKATKTLIIPADWKSSNKMDKTYGLQLAAYAYLYGESKGWNDEEIWQRLPKGLVVRVDKRKEKSNELEIKWFDGLRYYFDVFKALRLAYDFQNSTGAWKPNV